MILGILILAFILWLSISFQAENTTQRNKPEKVCPPHRWSYFKPFEDSDEEQILCLVCKKTPTQIVGESGTRE